MAQYGESIQFEPPDTMGASIDMDNVSCLMPALRTFFGTPCPDDLSGHHPNFTKAAGAREVFLCAVRCGKGLALTGWDVLSDKRFLFRGRENFCKEG